jgi:hypothetical protein
LSGSIFCYRSFPAILRKKIGKPKEEIRRLNGLECMYLSDLKVPYFLQLSSISIKVISMSMTGRISHNGLIGFISFLLIGFIGLNLVSLVRLTGHINGC